MTYRNLFDVEFIRRGCGQGPFPKGEFEFLPGARVSLKELSDSSHPRVLIGTYSDFGDCRIAVFTHEGETALKKTFIVKGLRLVESESPMFVGGFWWHSPDDKGPTIPPDDIGSWTATSGGNQGGGDG